MTTKNHTPLAQSQTPLADRMRPKTLAEFAGQAELVGKDSFLRKAIEQDKVPSMILWGPPGSGKTTLAHIIAQMTGADFVRLSAVSSGKKDLEAVIERAEASQRLGQKTILFIDEIHRWNKAQQDALLPNVEKGLLTLIGATTENPSFEVISALLSRARVFVLHPLSDEDLEQIVKNALDNTEQGLGAHGVKIENSTIGLIAHLAHGDARSALNIIEAAVNQNPDVTDELIKQIVQKSHLLYDKTGEEHYNIISALHKSMRGHDADAAVYWLARMLEGGEDPLYIARRLVRFASEDIGLADSQALLIANAAFDACHKIGMPECTVHLTQAVIYLAQAKKSVTVYQAYERAKKDVEEHGALPVPLHIRNAPTKLMKDLGYGKDYKYTPKVERSGTPHQAPNNSEQQSENKDPRRFGAEEDSTDQTYLPEELQGKKYVQ